MSSKFHRFHMYKSVMYSTIQPKSLPKSSKNKKFIDWKRIKAQGGRGGNGCVSFRRERYLPWGGPNGGDGGNGGNVIFVASPRVTSMRSLRYNYKAQNGGNGEGMDRRGLMGEDITIQVPIGTVVKEDGRVIADLTTEGASFVVAKGGTGGRGNVAFASPEVQTPREANDGTNGEERIVEVELKTIADVGMVGLPNAGKSTLLRCISRARPKVASYPFTTLNPHIGVIATPDGTTRLSVADIPGILPGAHDNVGLGHSFLRHIERCHSLLYVLDPSSDTLPEHLIKDSSLINPETGSVNLFEQLLLLQNELKEYDNELLDKHQMVIVNKMDLAGMEQLVRELSNKTNLFIIPVSGLHRLNIDCLINILLNKHRSTIL